MHRDSFSGYHPILNFIFFALVLVVSMFVMHPVYLGVSFAGALLYALKLQGKKALGFSLKFMLPMMLIAALVNAAFNHQGATILLYLPSGNPLTLESILHGLNMALMLGAVMLWFVCFSAVITSDKFVYLFGRIIPALSLILSMILRFVPAFMAQFRSVSEAQRCVGRDISTGKLTTRIRNAITVFSIMVTWCLENAIETADSMKSRGYGLPGRTAYSIYRFDKRDKKTLLWLIFCTLGLLVGGLLGGMAFRFYPTIRGAGLTLWTLIPAGIFLALCLTPVFMDLWEVRKWKHLK